MQSRFCTLLFPPSAFLTSTRVVDNLPKTRRKTDRRGFSWGNQLQEEGNVDATFFCSVLDQIPLHAQLIHTNLRHTVRE